MADKISVLFLCVHNSARSQLAEGILRMLAGDRLDVFSAGSTPSRVHPLAERILEERGIDPSHHRSKSVAEFQHKPVDVIITLCAEEVCPLFFNATRKYHWPLPDPAAVTGSESEQLEAFRQTAAELEKRLNDFLEERVS